MSLGAVIGGFVAANGGPVALAVLGAQIVGRAIPDNKRGVLGVIRKVAKVVGMYSAPDLDRVKNEAIATVESVVADEVTRRVNAARTKK